jgi:hypothetical protein
MSDERTIVPQKVQEYVLAQTGERRLHLQLAAFNFDVTSREFLDNEIVGVNLVKRFPFISEIRMRHMDVVMKGEDPEHPLSLYTLAQFRCGPLGIFYFLFQGIEPNFFFTGPEAKLNPVFSKENVLKSLAPGATTAKVKVTDLLMLHKAPLISSRADYPRQPQNMLQLHGQFGCPPLPPVQREEAK